MTYSVASEPVMPMVPVRSRYGLLVGSTTDPTSGTVPANVAMYMPVVLPGPCVARRMWWANGSTVSASYNIEAAIYRDGGFKPGARLVTTGSVAQGTATAIQFGDITDTTLTPGLWWLAFGVDNASATFFRNVVTPQLDNFVSGYTESATIGSFPATATPAEWSGQSRPHFGFSTTTIT